MLFFFSSRRRHTRWPRDWSSDVCSSDLRSGVTLEVLRKIARNPATAEHTLEYLIDVDERGLIFPVTRRTDVSEEFIDRIARRLTDRTAIYREIGRAPRRERELDVLCDAL